MRAFVQPLFDQRRSVLQDVRRAEDLPFGLDAALHYAAGKAGLGDSFRVSEFPRKKELGEAIAEMIHRIRPGSAKLDGIYGAMVRRVESELKTLQNYNDPAGLYARLPVALEIK